jgi:uncharacterized protein
MKVLFELSHPKHYYQFKGLINKLIIENNEIIILAREKDVLLNILDKEGLDYYVPGKHGARLPSKFLVLPRLLLNYFLLVRSFKPALIVSKSSPYAVIMRLFFKVKLIIMPDSEVVALTNKFVAPLSHFVITSETYTIDYGKKHRRIKGFFEETYLSPFSFIPDKNILKKYDIEVNKPLFILRFIGWSANHDVGHFGFNKKEKIQLVETLKNYGNVLISAEYNIIPKQLNPYLLKILPNDIHHFLFYASAYIGDSQTMATESALLGTPSFRYNSFVGKNDMSNFLILEKELDMLRNHSSFTSLLKDIEKIVCNQKSKEDWLQKRESYFKTKPDINTLLYNIVREVGSI